MTARLPNPGGDVGDWGTILNDFLGVAHNGDGTLQDGSINDAQIASNAGIAESKLNLASDAAANVPSRRTLGTNANQSAAGNDTRITGAEQIANKGQPNGYAGLDSNRNLAITANILNLSPVAYSYSSEISNGGPNSAYIIADKANTASDASLVLRDQGNVRVEIGISGDDNLHIKTAAGINGSEVFTDRLLLLASGSSWFPGKLGVGTLPVEQFHVSSSASGSRTLIKVENTNLAAGSVGAGMELSGNVTDWSVGTDAGLNGNNNFFIQDNNAGYPPRVLIDGSGNVAIGKDNATYKLDVVGDIASNSVGNGFRIKEGSNAKMGVAVLAGGAVTVSTTAITSNSRVFLTIQVPGGTVGAPYVSTRIASTSFTISSTSGTDTSTVAWILIEPS